METSLKLFYYDLENIFKEYSNSLSLLMIFPMSGIASFFHRCIFLCVLVAQSCLTPCNPMDWSPPGSSVHGILQARILEWVAISFSRGSSQPRNGLPFPSQGDLPSPGIKHGSPALQADSLPSEPPGAPLALQFSSVQFISVAQSCPTLCDPMNHSTPGLPVHHQLPEFTQTRVHRVSDAIQPSHPLSSPSPPAPNPSQHQSLFQWVNSSHEVAKVLEFQL